MNFNDDDDEDMMPRQDDSGDATMSSFADMMTLLLGFFIILYSISTMDEKKFYEFGKSIAASFKESQKVESDTVEVMQTSQQLRAFQMLIAVLNLGSEEEAIAKSEQLYAAMLNAQDSKDAIGSKNKEIKKLKAKVGDKDLEDDVLIELILPSSSLFLSGSDELTDSAKEQLGRFAKTIERVKENVEIEVIGHTDSRPPGRRSNFANNWQLSTARATSVASQFQEAGIKGDRITVTGKASYDPLYAETDPSGRFIAANLAKNRRVQIKIRKTARR